MVEFEQGDVVLCTVERIEKTIVFVRIENNGDGSIVTSEIAPGRIRNLRDYVLPKKKIVCKVLRISPTGNIELSLRRVTNKERKEVLDKYQQERSYISVLRTILKEKAEKAIEEIQKQGSVYDFFEEFKENPLKFEKIIETKEAEKILEIVLNQKQKRIIIKKEFSLTTIEPQGVSLIKNILKNIKNAEVRYIAAGKYSIKTEDTNPKEAEQRLRKIIENIEKQAKKSGINFSVREK